MDSMTLDCEVAEAVQGRSRAELDELGPGTGDKGVQKCVNCESQQHISFKQTNKKRTYLRHN